MFLKEFKEFIKNILAVVYLWFGVSFFLFCFNLKEIKIIKKSFLLPFPSVNSFSSQIFKKIQNDLLPEGVKLIVTNPLSAFLAQVSLSLLIALILISPLLFYKMIKYLSPALFEKEKKCLIKTLFPSVLLFFLGCVFAYFLLIPAVFKALYPFAISIGAIPFFSATEFIGLVFGLIFASGLIFLLPVFMILLSSLGIIEFDFWRKNWRYAVLIFLIFSAIITPDGTGISMMMLSAPLTGLYFLGTIITTKNVKCKIKKFS